MFRFQARWKEELIVDCEFGSFMLELVGNPLAVYLPTQAVWVDRVPDWAKELWPGLHSELHAWFMANRVLLSVDESARVY